MAEPEIDKGHELAPEQLAEIIADAVNCQQEQWEVPGRQWPKGDDPRKQLPEGSLCRSCDYAFVVCGRYRMSNKGKDDDCFSHFRDSDGVVDPVIRAFCLKDGRDGYGLCINEHIVESCTGYVKRD